MKGEIHDEKNHFVERIEGKLRKRICRIYYSTLFRVLQNRVRGTFNFQRNVITSTCFLVAVSNHAFRLRVSIKINNKYKNSQQMIDASRITTIYYRPSTPEVCSDFQFVVVFQLH